MVQLFKTMHVKSTCLVSPSRKTKLMHAQLQCLYNVYKIDLNDKL